MFDFISSLPWPSGKEIFGSVCVFILLYVPKRVIDRMVDMEEKRIRKALIREHVTHHKGRFRTCVNCLTKSPEKLGLEMESPWVFRER